MECWGAKAAHGDPIWAAAKGEQGKTASDLNSFARPERGSCLSVELKLA